MKLAHGRRTGVLEEGVRFVTLDRQHETLEYELKETFARVLAASAFTLGTEVEEFETEFAAYCGVEHCVGVASGTAALSLILTASGIGPGDEVIVPAHTFIASALGVAHAGATPVLCDVQADTGLIDPKSVAELIGPRTAAIIAVHLYGQACDMDALADLAAPHGILVFEDAAQAHGARYRARPVGSLGAAAGFSFYPSKNLGALGDGGAICTDDAGLAQRVRQLRNLGQRRKGEHVEVGFNERLDGLQAALLRVKLPHLDAWNAARREHAAAYRERLPDYVRVLGERDFSPCVYHLFPVRLANRDNVGAALAELNIETGVHYGTAMHRHPAWEGQPMRHGEVPEAEAWAAEELSLPMHPDLEPAEIELVADALCAALKPAHGR
jgi:dTDP-3-amino-3,4,6-trideoxy-alpha-D-glucose transaminase